MADTVFADEPQTVELLQSMRILMRWLSSVPAEIRQRFLGALAECSDDVQNVVFQMVSVVENPHATPLERHRALATIADALFLNPDDGGEYVQDFAASGATSAAEYASLARGPRHGLPRSGLCRSPAQVDDSQVRDATRICPTGLVAHSRQFHRLLNRKSRPQKKTVVRLAEALQVQPQELWPDLETADMLDAVADFQEDDHVMTEAEAKALRDSANQNVPKIPVGSLPARQAPKGQWMPDHPHQLYAVELHEADQARLAGFTCGDEAWSRHAAEWIRGSDVLDSIAKGTKVWLFENAGGEIVGFGSVGRTRWRWPLPDGSYTSILLIPMLGLRTSFQGQPPDPDWRFARQIMSHLIHARARDVANGSGGRCAHQLAGPDGASREPACDPLL